MVVIRVGGPSVPSPFPGSTSTAAVHSTAATSCSPSPSVSPIARSTVWLTVIVSFTVKRPAPSPSRVATVFPKKSAVTRSGLPSPFRSAVWRSCDGTPAATVCHGPNVPEPVPAANRIRSSVVPTSRSGLPSPSKSRTSRPRTSTSPGVGTYTGSANVPSPLPRHSPTAPAAGRPVMTEA